MNLIVPASMEMTHIMFLEQKRPYFIRSGYPTPHCAALYQKIYSRPRHLHKPFKRINLEIRGKISDYFSFLMLEETQTTNLFYILLIMQLPFHLNNCTGLKGKVVLG